jgi:hypothetical protein
MRRPLPREWCSWWWLTAFADIGRAGQLAIVGRLTAGSSLNGAMVSRGHVAAALDDPFIVLFEQDRADEANNSVFIGEDADDLSVRRLISPLTRSSGLV